MMKLLFSAGTVSALFFCTSVSPLLHAQGNGVADASSRYVNPFTGDFSYSTPLLAIPGPNGERFPVTAEYNAGIGMEQQSSWWSINIGEISRSVNGLPDDWKERTYTEVNGSGASITNTAWGTLYLDDFEHPNLGQQQGPEKGALKMWITE